MRLTALSLSLSLSLIQARFEPVTSFLLLLEASHRLSLLFTSCVPLSSLLSVHLSVCLLLSLSLCPSDEIVTSCQSLLPPSLAHSIFLLVASDSVSLFASLNIHSSSLVASVSFSLPICLVASEPLSLWLPLSGSVSLSLSPARSLTHSLSLSRSASLSCGLSLTETTRERDQRERGEKEKRAHNERERERRRVRNGRQVCVCVLARETQRKRGGGAIGSRGQ